MNESALAKYLRWLVYGSALIPLVIFAQYVSPFHFGKAIVFRVIVEVMLVLYLLLIWRDRSYLPKASPLTWAFLAFTLAFTLTTITSVSSLQSFWGTLERMGGLFTFWHYFIFYIIAVAVLRTAEDWRTLIDLMVAVGLVSAIYAFLQKTDLTFILGSGGRSRPFGTIGNPALFAGYQIVVAYLATTLLLTKHLGPNAAVLPNQAEQGGKLLAWGFGATILVALLTGGQGLWVIPLGVVAYGAYLVAGSLGAARWFYIGAAGLMFLAAISTAVRGSLLAIGVATILFTLLWSALWKSRRAKSALLASVAGVALFLFLALLLRNTPLVKESGYLSRVTDFSSSTFTVQTRFWAWEAGLKGWAESPRYMLVGWGPENFNIPFSKHFNPKFFTGPGAETFFDRAHNMFVEVLVTMGLAGILTYLALFGMLFWTLARLMKYDDDRRTLGIGLTSLTVAYAIHNAFIFDTTANYLAFFTVVAFVAHISQRGLDGQTQVAKLKPSPWTGSQAIAAGVLGIFITIFIWATGVLPAMANYASTRAIIFGWNGDFFGAVNKYREAIDYDTPGRYEFRHRFAQYILEISTAADTSEVPNFNDVVARAIEDVQANVDESPHDYLPFLYMSRMSLLLAKDDPKSPYNDVALGYANQALEISPTFVRTYYEIAQGYLNKKDYDKAAEWFRKALALNPDVPVTPWYLGMVLIQQGQAAHDVALVQQGLQQIGTAIEHGYTLTEADALRIIDVYKVLGDFNNVAGIYAQLVMSFPQKPDYWDQLIAAYLKVGNAKAAVDALQRAIKQPGVGDNPAFRAKAEATLKELTVK